MGGYTLIGKFREATTPEMVTVLAALVNDQVAELLRRRDGRAGDLKAELLQLEREAGHLVRFLAGLICNIAPAHLA